MFQKKSSDQPSPPNSVEDRRFTDNISLPETVIGSGITLRGDISGNNTVELRGTIEGQSDLHGPLIIRKGGRFAGDIKAESLVVEGTIEGNVVATNKIELCDSAHVTGNLQAGAIAISEGSFFQGEVKMTPSSAKDKPFVFSEKRGHEPTTAAATEPTEGDPAR